MIKSIKIKKLLILTIVATFLIGAVIPSIQASELREYKGFDKGLSYKPVVPIKKVTFVNFDEDSLLDDYAYLSAVPTAVFQEDNKLISHPLMFYQEGIDYNEYDEEYKSIDAFQGIKYFMEDWMSYSNGELDQMTLINVDKNKLNRDWKAKDYATINGNDPYSIANALALQDWSYSDEAVVAVIGDDFKAPEEKIENTIKDSLSASKVYHQDTMYIKQTNRLNPIQEDFHVDDKYVYLRAEASWDGILFLDKMIPTGDPDLQLFVKKDDGWMQAAATAQWNVYSPAGREYTQCHVYNSGDWRVGITDFPTEGDGDLPRIGIPGIFEIQGNPLGILRPNVIYNVDITMYPGKTISIPDMPPFGCNHAEFKLTWDNPNVNLGFTLLGPGGEAILTSFNESDDSRMIEMELDQLGECLPGESYKVAVFTLDDALQNVDFEIEYTWEQNVPKEKVDAITSASEGAVLASQINAPLLYTSSKNLPKGTVDVLYKLGIKKIYLMNFGNHVSKSVYNEIDSIVNIDKNYVELDNFYEDIINMTDSTDIIFTTTNTWTSWLADKLEPEEDSKGGYYVGPATYLAAHHGSPVIILENHPELSSSVVWHNEFWKRFSHDRYKYKPPVSEMTIIGNRVYDFLKNYGFNKDDKEFIVTVAGQYEIGMPWDRMFPGVAHSGRICGTPVDTSVWISRNVFYPALIFENPALKQKTVTLTNGSTSYRDGLKGLIKKPFLNTLVIDNEGGAEEFEYPVLCSFVTHKYRFNERASKYYGTQYQCADGSIPGVTESMEPIDQGVNQVFNPDDDGGYFPDMTETVVVPFYLEKGEFDPVFSTNLDAVADNLNEGVLLWIHASHGHQDNGGETYFWDVETAYGKNHRLAGIVAGSKHETNPWRGYDWMLGSTEEPDTMTMDMQGFIPFTNHKSLLMPATGMDWVLARKPVKELINKLIFPRYANFPFETENLYDGLTGTLLFSTYPLVWKNSSEIEPLLDNLHSTGFITSICQTSNTYFHLMIIRHGSVFQVQDPWPTSWYGAVWRQSIPRDIILGDTVGEAYSKGISHVGPLYIDDGTGNGPQWWWDDSENVVFFGDPKLRMYVPGTEYSDNNYWEKKDVKPMEYNEEIVINGHAPFGATEYLHEEQQKTWFEQNTILIVILGTILILLIIMFAILKKK